MIDIEQLLRDDARRSAREQAPLPSLEDAVAQIMRLQVPAPRRGSWRSRWPRHLPVYLTVGAAVVIVAAAATYVVSTVGSHDRPAATAGGPPPSITVHGVALAYVASIPWANAVVDPANERVINVYADSDLTNAFCGVPTERVFTQQSATAVSVVVAGYLAHPTASVCNLERHAPVRQRVALVSPLHARALIDGANGSRHRLLDPATLPAVHQLPAGYEPQSPQWDEKTGVATVLSQRSGSRGTPASIRLTVGPASGIAAEGPPSGSAGPSLVIGTRRARTWYYQDQVSDTSTIQWPLGKGREIQLKFSTGLGDTLTKVQQVAIARSIY